MRRRYLHKFQSQFQLLISIKMFVDIVRIPTLILCVVTIWEVSIENAILRRLYEHCKYFIRIVFVFIPNILQIIYLTTVDDFQVSNTQFFRNEH